MLSLIEYSRWFNACIRHRQSHSRCPWVTIQLSSRPRMGPNIVSLSFKCLPLTATDSLLRLASTIFQQLLASDNASETFAGLKRIHGLMPYFMLKAVLKISNPMGMIRGVLDLFMAQPFGGRSLLQRYVIFHYDWP